MSTFHRPQAHPPAHHAPVLPRPTPRTPLQQLLVAVAAKTRDPKLHPEPTAMVLVPSMISRVPDTVRTNCYAFSLQRTPNRRAPRPLHPAAAAAAAAAGDGVERSGAYTTCPFRALGTQLHPPHCTHPRPAAVTLWPH